MLNQLTPNVHVVKASDISMEHFDSYRMTNPILVGLAIAQGLLPLKKDTVKGLLRGNAKEALELGIKS